MRPLVAHCRFGLGKLHAKTGQREKAKEHLATATTLYREMCTTFWLAGAESALKALGVGRKGCSTPCCIGRFVADSSR